ncbi:MAG: cytochrome d ubiquinol oxidase subunit II [Candidatus Azobacteroides sp.]|nr:cytochrome d ubiquinol oxidase subunit II [Candidatus Azobacteroides sp.]
MNLSFYQHYWWLLISLLGALLVFLLFVQGGQSLTYSIGKDAKHRSMLLASLSKKWELTFTTLVTFGGAFFASFPLFYSTSFGGAYWLWMLILFSFILQAVSYEFISKKGNLLGKPTYRFFLFLNGLLGPLFLGVAVSTFFTGANFSVNKENITGLMPVISSWQHPLHGLEALGVVWNLILGLAIFFLARCLGCLYFINNIKEDDIRKKSRIQLLINAIGFLVFFLPYLIMVLLKDGYAKNPVTETITVESFKYWYNLLAMPWVLTLITGGVVLVLYGFIRSYLQSHFIKGIWFAGTGTVLVVFSIFVLAGFNHTAYYPSLADPQSSLTIANSSSSLFTLQAMSIVSLLIPFVLAYIFYVWRVLDKKKITASDLEEEQGY